jgi:hypothetical protein
MRSALWLNLVWGAVACSSSASDVGTQPDLAQGDGSSAIDMPDSTTPDIATRDLGVADDASRKDMPDVAPHDASAPEARILDCSTLPASSQWESIMPSGIVNAQAITLDPFEAGTLWLGAGTCCPFNKSRGGLYKSTDCGATWSHVNTGTNGATIDGGAIWSMAIDPVQRGVIYVVSAYGPWGLWKSTNGGVDWTQMITPDFASTAPAGPGVPPAAGIGSVSMDPTDHLHLLVGLHSDCVGPFAPACSAASTDGGATWNIHRTPFLMHWAEQAGPYVLNANSWIYQTVWQGIWLTQDRGATWRNVTPSGNVVGGTSGEFTHRPIWQGRDGTYYLPSFDQGGTNGGLLRSADGLAWSLIPGSPRGGHYHGFAVAGGRIFLANGDDATQYSVTSDPPTTWSPLPNPPVADPKQGAAFLEYDVAHKVLYSSNFNNGVWRIVIP